MNSADATLPGSRAIPLARATAGIPVTGDLRATTRPFALELRAARGGVPLHQGTALQAPAADPRVTLRKVSHEFEAAFLRQMLAAMRASVPHEDAGGRTNPGEDMFTSMLDDRLASVAAARSRGGLGDATYRQLSQRLPPDSPVAPRSDR